jgi:hypothetical protein
VGGKYVSPPHHRGRGECNEWEENMSHLLTPGEEVCVDVVEVFFINYTYNINNLRLYESEKCNIFAYQIYTLIFIRMALGIMFVNISIFFIHNNDSASK